MLISYPPHTCKSIGAITMPPGWLYLLLFLSLPACAADHGDVASLVEHLVDAGGSSNSAGSGVFNTKSWMAQLGESVVFVHQGKVVKQWNLTEESASQVSFLRSMCNLKCPSHSGMTLYPLPESADYLFSHTQRDLTPHITHYRTLCIQALCIVASQHALAFLQELSEIPWPLNACLQLVSWSELGSAAQSSWPFSKTQMSCADSAIEIACILQVFFPPK